MRTLHGIHLACLPDKISDCPSDVFFQEISTNLFKATLDYEFLLRLMRMHYLTNKDLAECKLVGYTKAIFALFY